MGDVVKGETTVGIKDDLCYFSCKARLVFLDVSGVCPLLMGRKKET